MLHIYFGEGKGKTTCAFGLTLRAAGNDYKVFILQFLKYRQSGEILALSNFENVTVFQSSGENLFSWQMNDEQKEISRENHNLILYDLTKELKNIKDEKVLIVFDELLGAMEENLVDSKFITEFIKENKNNYEIVVTGRYPSEELLSLSDYATEMKKHKHPFDKGQKMRKGIEF